MERETGFEPATPSLEGSCSSQLSYSRTRAVDHCCIPRPTRWGISALRSRARSVVERGGFEPPKAKPADLQSAPFDRFGTSPFATHEKTAERAVPIELPSARSAMDDPRTCTKTEDVAVLAPAWPTRLVRPDYAFGIRSPLTPIAPNAVLESPPPEKFPPFWSWRWDSNP